MSNLTRLFEVVAAYLEPREPWREFAAAFAAGALTNLPGPGSAIGAWIPPALEPACADPLIATIHAAADVLTWRQNKNYVDPAFLSAYAYCELLGPAGHARDVAISAGLLCLKPGTHYPSHAHPAHEVYHLLSGTSQWQRGSEAWIERHAGERIDHPSGVSHAMRALHEPMLALYLWRGDLSVPARLLIGQLPVNSRPIVGR